MTHTRLIKAPYFYFPMIVFLNMKIILVIVIFLKNTISVFHGWIRNPGSRRGGRFTQNHTYRRVLISPLKAQRCRGAWRCPGWVSRGQRESEALSLGMAMSLSFSIWPRKAVLQTWGTRCFSVSAEDKGTRNRVRSCRSTQAGFQKSSSLPINARRFFPPLREGFKNVFIKVLVRTLCNCWYLTVSTYKKRNCI